MNELLLAADAINLASRNNIKDVINVVAICVLIFAYVRLLVQVVRIAHDAVSVERRCVRHDDQVVQIHQEAQEVEEGLRENLVRVVPLRPVQQVPHVLDRLRLGLQFGLIKRLDEA